MDGSNSGDDYDYDPNGNLTQDLNKEISSISYNDLNKPTKITYNNGNIIRYYYSADGMKLRQTVYSADQSDPPQFAIRKRSDYLGTIHYEDSDGDGTTSELEILLAQHEEGRMRPNGSEMIYEYNLTDHLGNTRITFGDADADGTQDILQENHYYPFGMAMTMSSTPTAAPPNDYLYNGKELQTELGLDWYDYGARMYDASIGRWNGVDALAEDYMAWSPYRYGFNNPLRYIDPSGNLETDYYNLRGQLVKHVEDGSSEKVLVLTRSRKLEVLEQTIDAGEVAPVASNAALKRMDESYDITEETGNEAGFAVATDGDVSSIAIGDGGKVDVVPKRSELLQQGKTIAYDVHTHPNDEENGDYGAPTPSAADKEGVPTELDSQNSVILGYTAREVVAPGQSNTLGAKKTETRVSRTIGFYNQDGSKGTLDYERYKKVIRKINEN